MKLINNVEQRRLDTKDFKIFMIKRKTQAQLIHAVISQDSDDPRGGNYRKGTQGGSVSWSISEWPLGQQPVRKQEPQCHNHTELNSANNLASLEEDPEFQKRRQPSPHLAWSLWDPDLRTRQSHAQTPEWWKLWITNVYCFKLLSL